MTPLRALALPFQFTSLLLAGTLACLLALVAATSPALMPPRLLGLYILLSWLMKYAFSLLDHAANGHVNAPVASVELLGPVGDLRAWVHPTLAILIALGTWFWAPHQGVLVATAASLLWPASVSGLAITHRLRDAVDPRALWQNALGLGRAYLLAVSMLATSVMLGMALWMSRLPSAFMYFALALLGFALHAFMGGLIHLRRHDLGFEPARSPERTQASRDADRARRFQQLVDRLFHACRSRNAGQVQRELRDWFGPLDDMDFDLQRQELLARTEEWGDGWASQLLHSEFDAQRKERA